MTEAKITERFDKRSSRTFTMSDREYEAITALANRKGITRTNLILQLVEAETKTINDQV